MEQTGGYDTSLPHAHAPYHTPFPLLTSSIFLTLFDHNNRLNQPPKRLVETGRTLRKISASKREKEKIKQNVEEVEKEEKGEERKVEKDEQLYEAERERENDSSAMDYEDDNFYVDEIPTPIPPIESSPSSSFLFPSSSLVMNSQEYGTHGSVAHDWEVNNSLDETAIASSTSIRLHPQLQLQLPPQKVRTDSSIVPALIPEHCRSVINAVLRPSTTYANLSSSILSSPSPSSSSSSSSSSSTSSSSSASGLLTLEGASESQRERREWTASVPAVSDIASLEAELLCRQRDHELLEAQIRDRR